MFATKVKQEPLPAEEKNKNPRVILVEFKNGNLTSSGKKNLTFTCYQNTQKKNVSFAEKVLVSKSRTMCYAGYNFETETSKITSSLLKLFVVNKKNSSFKLYDIDYFILKPQIKSPEILTEIQTEDSRSYGEKASELTLAFGSKSLQKSISTRKRYGDCAEVSDPLAISKISENVETSSISLPAESQTSSAIPPQNSSAKSIDEVYNLNDIISLEEMDALTSNAEVFLHVTKEKIEQWRKENIYSLFIVQFLENNMLCMNSHKAKLLLYLHYMFCFLKTVYADWKKKDPVPSVPEPFKQKIMDSFTLNKSCGYDLREI